MIKAIISDFSKVILLSKSDTKKGLNNLHEELKIESNYKIFNHFLLNQELLDFYQRLKKRFNIKLYLYTAGILHDENEIKEIIENNFDKIYGAFELDLPKDDPDSFKTLAGKIGIETNEILFIDDSFLNIEAASKSGVNVIQYMGNKNLKELSVEIINREMKNAGEKKK